MLVLDDFQGSSRLFVRIAAQVFFDGVRFFLSALQIDRLPLDVPRPSTTIGVDRIRREQLERGARWLVELRIRFRFVGNKRSQMSGDFRDLGIR